MIERHQRLRQNIGERSKPGPKPRAKKECLANHDAVVGDSSTSENGKLIAFASQGTSKRSAASPESAVFTEPALSFFSISVSFAVIG